MRNDQKALVSEVFCEVIEKLAFMFGEPVEKEDMPQAESGYVQAEISFAGPITGMLAVAAPEEMCAEIAANALGAEPDDDLAIEQAKDAFKEVINITCGHILTAIADSKAVFDLSVPTINALDANEWTAFANMPDTLGFLIDENPVLLRLSMEDASA